MKTCKSQSLILIILSVCLSLVLVSCGGTAGQAASNTSADAPGSFKVAMIFPGPIDDKSWSQAGYEGLQLIEKELKAEIAYTASVSPEDAEQIFRKYAEEGYRFIVGHGGEYIPAAEVVAKAFPRTKFAVVAGYPGNNQNLGAMSFRDAELGYLTGVIAALKTKTNKIVYIGGEPYPHTQEQATLYERGAKAINPAIEVSVEWVKSWTDQAKAGEIAQTHIEAGADVLMIVADTAGEAAFKEAKEAGVYAIGWSIDQHELAPDTILTSGIQRVPVLLLEGTRLVQQGRWEGKQYEFGLQEGAQELAPFYGLLSPEQEKTVKQYQGEIISGKLDVAP